MNAARIELALVLDRLGVPIDLGTFSKRFNIQKKIYLLQLMGIDLGFRFGWYIRGPYAPPLTADAFTLKDELDMGENDHQDFKLSEDAVAKVEKAKALWRFLEGVGMDPDEWIELLASIHYLKHIAYWPKGSNKDFEAIFKALIDAKPRFSNSQMAARRAWKRLDEFGLIAAKTIS